MSSIVRIILGIAVIVAAFIAKGKVEPVEGEGAESTTVAIWGITTAPTVIYIVIGIAFLIGLSFVVAGVVGLLRKPR